MNIVHTNVRVSHTHILIRAENKHQVYIDRYIHVHI